MEKLATSRYAEIGDYKIKTYLETYEILQQILNSPDYSISKQEILARIDYNFQANSTTINKIVERHNERFRIIFNFSQKEYSYNRTTKRYHLEFTHISKLAHHKVLYDYLLTISIANRLEADSFTLSKAFMVSSEQQYKNIPLLFKIVEAINQKKRIQFKHHNHFTGETCLHKVEPWFVKYFENNFFLGCYRIEKNGKQKTEYRHFTISQIEENSLVVLEEEINLKTKEEEYPTIEHEIFESCIGIRIYKEDNPFEKCFRGDIYVETDYTTGKNWLNTPIHQNQKLLMENKKEYKFLFVFENFYLNESFKGLILASAARIKIINPKEAIEEIKISLKKNLANYE